MFFSNRLYWAIALLLILGFPPAAQALMTSSNYTIYADSINSGGIFSTSSSFRLEDTIAEGVPVIFSSSTSYDIRAGYQAMERGSIIMTISDTSLDLGTLSAATVNTASTTVSITTDASSGYALSISGVSGTSLTGVSDGTVTAGSEEYGFAGSGTDNLVSGDVAVAAATSLASSSTAVTASDTVLTFKASISGSTSAGSRSQTVTLTASANL